MNKIINAKYYDLSYLIIAFLTGLAIPVSTALENICVVLIGVIVLFTQEIRLQLKDISKNYFVVCCVLLYLLYCIWVFIGHAPLNNTLHMLSKMRIFILAPLIFIFYKHYRNRILSVYGFLIGSGISLLVSLGMFIFQKPLFSATKATFMGNIGDWAAFRYHTYHNYFLALAVGILLTYWLYDNKISKITKLLFSVFILIASIDILYLVQGRTGQILFMVILFLVFLLWNFKKGLIASLIIILLIIFAWFTSDAIKCEINRIRNEVLLYNRGNADTSVGERMEFHKYTLELIKKNPIIGYGTGSFPSTYKAYTGFSGQHATAHPHNDFYWIWFELGILGIITVISILLSAIYYAIKQKTPEGKFALIIVITYIICALQGGAFTDNISSVAFIELMAIFLSGIVFKINN